MNRPPRRNPGFDEIFDHLILAINSDRLAAGQLRHVDVMTTSIEADVQPVVPETLMLEPLSYAHRNHQIDRALLENAGTNAFNNIFAAAIFDDYRVNSV